MLADQRQEAQRTQELVHGHLNAMALRLGELQARMMRLDGLGERLAKVAGLTPQELPVAAAPARPGAAARCRRCLPRALTVDRILGSCSRSSAARSRSAPTSLASSRRCSSPIQPTASSCRRCRRSSTAGSRPTFGYRIDPFNGLQSFHEGIDFPPDNGTPIVAAASGKVIESGYQPQYGKIVVIDHGNGLVSRYAHASEVYVNEGDLVVRGQRVASVGSTGPLDRSAPAFRGSAEWRTAESRAVSALPEVEFPAATADAYETA